MERLAFGVAPGQARHGHRLASQGVSPLLEVEESAWRRSPSGISGRPQSDSANGASPTIAFQLLFVFVILDHGRRRPIHFAVTSSPTAEWTAATSWKPSPGILPWVAPRPEGLFCIVRKVPHASFAKDAPVSRPVEPPLLGPVIEIPNVGGLHHLYTRKAA